MPNAIVVAGDLVWDFNLYRDEGVSGTRDLDDREGLSELLTRIRANGVRVVIVKRGDRVARDLLVSEVILDNFAILACG